MPFENFIERCWKYGVSKFACRSRRVVSNTDDGIQAPTWAQNTWSECMHMENNRHTYLFSFVRGAISVTLCRIHKWCQCHASSNRFRLIRIITAWTISSVARIRKTTVLASWSPTNSSAPRATRNGILCEDLQRRLQERMCVGTSTQIDTKHFLDMLHFSRSYINDRCAHDILVSTCDNQTYRSA